MIKGLILSLQFLTRIPLNINIYMDKENIMKSTFFFPFIGMIIGAFSALIYNIGLYFDKDIGAILAVVSLILITGGLHMDGLADTCDGFFSSRKKEQILDIMKDSRSGTFGVIALLLDILIKYILLTKLSGDSFICLMLSCGNARLTAVMLMCFTKPARQDGLGILFSKNINKNYFYFGLIIYSILTAALFHYKYLIMLVVGFIVTFFVALKSYKTIGGLTGDVYGANIELCEIAGIATFLGVSLWI